MAHSDSFIVTARIAVLIYAREDSRTMACDAPFMAGTLIEMANALNNRANRKARNCIRRSRHRPTRLRSATGLYSPTLDRASLPSFRTLIAFALPTRMYLHSRVYGNATGCRRWAAESPGPIADRTREHLGTTDIAIIKYRCMLRDAILPVSKRPSQRRCR